MAIIKDLGIATAYGYAVAGGYTGTEEEFAALLANYAAVAEDVEQSTTAAEQAAVAAAESAENAEHNAEDSEAWAVGKRNGSDVESTDEAYHNNAKYYAEQAGSSANEAAESAQRALEAVEAVIIEADSAKIAAITAITEKGEETLDSIPDDYTELSNNVDDLKSAFDDAVVKEQGKNLFDGEFVNGYFANDGTITTHANWISTKQYIDVRNLTAITTSGYRLSSSARETMNMFYLCTYNASKQFIANVGQVNNTYTIGENVCYVRFSIHPDYYSDIQVESGTTASGYEPYSVEYKFSDSPYLSEYVIDKFNIYDKANNINGEYINSSGTVVSSSNGIRCLVPCKYGDVLDICRPQRPNYSSGNGLMLVYNNSMTVLASVDMSQYATIEYGQYAAVRYPVTDQTAAFISFNVKLSNYDSTNDTIVTARNINGSYTGNYISEIESYKLWAVNGVEPIWKGKKWACVGDSLTANNIRTTKHYFDYVSDETGIETYNMGDSGSGYAAEQDTDTAFYQRISDVPLDSDVITIFGSFNDLGTEVPLGDADDSGTDTIGGCINETLDNLFEVLPLANVGIVTPTPWQSQTPLNEPNSASAYVDLLIAVCKRRSIPCMDLFHCSLLRPWDSDFRELAYSKDDGGGTHPDETGHKIIAPRFKAFLETLLM